MQINSYSKDDIKGMVTRLRDHLAVTGSSLSQSQAYEAVAQMLGFKNWNTLSAMLETSSAARTAHPLKDQRIAICWPWVATAAVGKLRRNGTPHHIPLSWSTPLRNGTSTLEFQFPTLLREPSSFSLPVKGSPSEVDGLALLGIFARTLASILENYARDGKASCNESGQNLSQNTRYAVISYTADGAGTCELVLRAQGGNNFSEGEENLRAAARDAANDFIFWAKPMLDRYTSTGRPWPELERYGDWVHRALRVARLAEPYLA